MSLKFPDSDVDFVVTPAYFLGDFDVYDREETLGEYLSNFDPNDTEQLCKLLEEKFFNGGRLLKFSLGHKYELMRVLGIALADTDYDFETIIHHQDDYFCLPWSGEIKSPRSFFETIYLKMYEHWGRELIADGFDLAKPEELFV